MNPITSKPTLPTLPACCLRFRRSQPGDVRLFCFPHAGGGAAAYHAFSRLLPARVEVVAIVPPGREARRNEPPLTSIIAMAEEVVQAIVHLPPLPFVFFGHSMGAMIAFETARILYRHRWNLPQHMFLSGRRGPGSVGSERPIASLPDAAFVAEMVHRYQGIPEAILHDADLLTFLLPVLRADIRAVETYHNILQPPLPVPVTLMGGQSDPQCTKAAWSTWLPLIDAPITCLRLPGGHFYVAEERAAVSAAIAARL